jgi:hypothetical protein
VLIFSVKGRVGVDPIDSFDMLSDERQDFFLSLQIIFFLKSQHLSMKNNSTAEKEP